MKVDAHAPRFWSLLCSSLLLSSLFLTPVSGGEPSVVARPAAVTPVPSTPKSSSGQPAAGQAASRAAPTPGNVQTAPPEVRLFLNRVFAHVPSSPSAVAGDIFESWAVPNHPTKEAVALKRIPGIEVEAVMKQIMDVDIGANEMKYMPVGYHIDDPAFQLPGAVRFYQVIEVPYITRVQHELALIDAGMVRGYRLVYWYLLKAETQRLDLKNGARSEHNVGAWLVAPGVLGYALGSWPVKADLSWATWELLTTGANLAARKVFSDNLDDMTRRVLKK